LIEETAVKHHRCGIQIEVLEDRQVLSNASHLPLTNLLPLTPITQLVQNAFVRTLPEVAQVGLEVKLDLSVPGINTQVNANVNIGGDKGLNLGVGAALGTGNESTTPLVQVNLGGGTGQLPDVGTELPPEVPSLPVIPPGDPTNPSPLPPGTRPQPGSGDNNPVFQSDYAASFAVFPMQAIPTFGAQFTNNGLRGLQGFDTLFDIGAETRNALEGSGTEDAGVVPAAQTEANAIARPNTPIGGSEDEATFVPGSGENMDLVMSFVPVAGDIVDTFGNALDGVTVPEHWMSRMLSPTELTLLLMAVATASCGYAHYRQRTRKQEQPAGTLDPRVWAWPRA